MSYEVEYNGLKTENISLEKIINSGMTSTDEKIKAKKSLYLNKIKMLDLIHKKDDAKRTGVSAREYIARAKNKKQKPKYSTGIDKIDNHLGGGFQTGIFINVGGESFAGKSTLCLNILANMSISKKTAWFNFEMGERLFSKKLQEMKLNDNQLDNLYIEEDSRNIDDLLKEMELLIEDGYFCFCIDSKMKLNGGKGREDYQKNSDISTRLSEFAQIKDVIIIFINQMNEEDIKNKRLALKGSGDQKYDSDIILFVVLEEDKDNMKKVEDRKRFLICTKNRQTETTFREEITKYDYRYEKEKPVEIEFISDEELDSSFDTSSFDIFEE